MNAPTGTIGICTTCGKPEFPHPYRHPITTMQKPEHPPAGPSGISPRPYRYGSDREPDGIDYMNAVTTHLSEPDWKRIAEVPDWIRENTMDPSISLEAYAAAMRLLGLNPDDPDRALLTVHIEEGRIVATYGHIARIGAPEPTP